MSRKSKAEYIGEKRRAYESAKPAKRSKILSEVRETIGHTRKYVNKRLTGNSRYRERKGRGKAYKDEVFWLPHAPCGKPSDARARHASSSNCPASSGNTRGASPSSSRGKSNPRC